MSSRRSRLIRRGLDLGFAVELDVCSAVDGAIVHHDNDPRHPIAVLRRAGGSVGEFRPVIAGGLEDRRIDQLTVREIQAHDSYARDEKDFGADVETAARAAGALLKNLLS